MDQGTAPPAKQPTARPGNQLGARVENDLADLSTRTHVGSRQEDVPRGDVSARPAVDVGPSPKALASVVATAPMSTDEILKLAIKSALDEGDYQRAALLLDVLRQTP